MSNCSNYALGSNNTDLSLLPERHTFPATFAFSFSVSLSRETPRQGKRPRSLHSQMLILTSQTIYNVKAKGNFRMSQCGAVWKSPWWQTPPCIRCKEGRWCLKSGHNWSTHKCHQVLTLPTTVDSKVTGRYNPAMTAFGFLRGNSIVSP